MLALLPPTSLPPPLGSQFFFHSTHTTHCTHHRKRVEPLVVPFSRMRLSLGLVLALAASTAQAFVPRAPLLNTPSRQQGQSWSRLMAMKDVRVGIIGAGRIGIVHLEALASW